MALISSATIIRAVSLFHLTTAYFLLTNPSVIPTQNVVGILGKSMRLPSIAMHFEKATPLTGMIAVLLAFIGFSDFAASNLLPEVAMHYWTSQCPTRIFFLFACTGYAYFFKPGGIMAAKGSDYVVNVGDTLKNDIVFSWGFLELSLWYWVYTALRSERLELAKKHLAKQKAEEDHM